MDFEWDEQKARSNADKHGVSFEEAVTCFYDPLQVAFYDPAHSDEENREILIGHSNQNRVLVISYTLRHEVIRIISAQQATRREANDYAQGI